MVAALLFWFRKEIAGLRSAVDIRLQRGDAVKVAVAGFEVELGEVKVEVAGMQSTLDDLSKQVAALFLASMSEPMYQNLSKLADGFGSFNANDGLKRELSHLRDLGFVEVTGIRQLPAVGDDLNDYVKITPAGREFIRLREGSS